MNFSVLDAFARAAAGDQDALSQARASWPSLGVAEREVLGPIGSLLGSGETSAAFADALSALASGRRPESADLSDAQLSVLAPLIDQLLGAQVTPHAAEDDEATAALLAEYGHYSETDLEESDPGAFDLAEAYSAEAQSDAGPRLVGIETSLTPEDLLSRFGLTEFRPGQREAIVAALEGRDSLIVMPTGGGKSLCYQLPAVASDALTVVVSPLIALIADQHQRLLDLGQRSCMLASTLGEQANIAALGQVRDGWAQVVFCAPERFASAAFRSALARRRIASFVVDEAHCVSEWGHDFRPDYLRLRPVIEALGRPPVMAATATATPKVADEIVARLGLNDPVMVRRGFDRPNLSFDVLAVEGKGSVQLKRDTLLAAIKDPANRPAVVYCGTRKDTEEVAAQLCKAGLSAVGYHAGMDSEARQRNQQRFMAGEADTICATNAFGMGVDATIRSVVHFSLPSSVEAYYQEAGRAGRDGLPARALLMSSRQDLGRLVRFIDQAKLNVGDVKALLGRMSSRANDGVVTVDPRQQDDRDRIALSVAERSGAVSIAPAGAGQLAVRINGPLDEQAAERVCREAINRRWDAYHALKRFAATDDICRRRQLLDHFGDDEPTAPTGRCCDVCDPIDWLVVIPSAASPKKKAAVSAGPPVDEGQMGKLKAWRAARADGKPAYTVANNATLEEVLRVRPASSQAMLEIRGIGPAFVAKHGASLLDELNRL